MPATVKDGLARIRIVEGDVTRQHVDAIVNAANQGLRGGGGVDGAIHRAAGRGLLEELIERYPRGCKTGEGRITSGHGLAARYVIHAVGPRYRDGKHGEPDLLASAYRQAIDLAAEHGCKTIAFPAISCGIYGYPWDEAARIALRTVGEGLGRHPEIDEGRFVLVGGDIRAAFERACGELRNEDRPG